MFSICRPTLLAAAIATSAAALLSSATNVMAQSYPHRPIKLIIPYAAGGTGDGIVRLLSGPMEKKLGQKFVVESRPGALGNIGAQEVVRADPDGYTLLVGATNNFILNQFLTKMTFDPLASLVPIAKLGDIPLVLFGNPTQPQRTFAALADLIKKSPGKLNYGTPSPGTINHLFIERLKQSLGLDIVHVPFRGAPPATLALLQNDIQLFPVGLAAGIEHVASGKFVALAVATHKRMSQIPDVPTLIEQGFPGAVASNWFALAAPRGTPSAIIKQLEDAVVDAHRDGNVQQRFLALGMVLPDQTPSQFVESLAGEAKIWEQTIKTANIVAQ